jgi:agmatinase
MAAPSVLLQARRRAAHRFGYLGIPHDAATSLGNPGARFGPNALREMFRASLVKRLSDGKLADLDAMRVVDLSTVEILDFGDIALSYYDVERLTQQIQSAVADVLAAGCVPLICGGDHSISTGCIRALHEARAGRIGVIQLDAHCDLMDFSNRQGHLSGSSPMRRSVELPRLRPQNLVQIGLRGYTSVEQFEIGEKLGVRRIGMGAFNEMGAAAAAKQALKWARAGGVEAVYLTVDLDVLNPGEAPGTGWPEPGGMSAQQLFDFCRAVAPHAAAIDLAELNPLYDDRSATTVALAARLLIDCVSSRVES